MFVLIVLVWLLMATNTSALTMAEAQKCADELLSSYNTKNYPARLLLVEAITSRTFGATYRLMGDYEKYEAVEATRKVLRESFEESTGKYQYRDLSINVVEAKKNGFRIKGDVYIVSPKYTGSVSFMVLVNSECKIEQARIGEIYALDVTLREMLKRETRWKDLLR
ncbi:hypothetical protein COZ82_02470 [Candidatus Kaiserbacteria bacterium CG_4_8_14_3_um_filter_38_9]|uniref:FlgO domain-containing protein n=1 Tax=Candidatus Kaiserbacteria bacterium CG_4_8_14_3_um_filter_38_9 TaxID=1974599 RepID=A0A2M7INM9_9BACT|nr:MAG: hypothetical protein COZ82_02470 [Candidatus Kaiserbacteria bacterium CG_4_8_14_3_um_filter_38_9]